MPEAPTLRRIGTGPLITPNLDVAIGDNVNGASVIESPSWLEGSPGRYWMYFAHHQGKSIRLAVADAVEGPWRMLSPSVLDIQQAGFTDHIASPDVHVFDEKQEVRMYFHGCGHDGWPHQPTKLAISKDGTQFRVSPEILGSSYWRVFQYLDYFYTLEMPGVFRRSLDGVNQFEEGPHLFDEHLRHSAVHLRGHFLHIFFSKVGDAPEAIYWTWIDLRNSWDVWRLEVPPVCVLAPELAWEGAELPVKPSERGPAPGPVHQLRDPCIFVSGQDSYLFYSAAGESAIAAAQIIW